MTTQEENPVEELQVLIAKALTENKKLKGQLQKIEKKILKLKSKKKQFI